MPLTSYGVLSGGVVDTRREGSTDSPHYQFHLLDNIGVHYRVAVNVESAQSPSELLYLVVDDFQHPVTGFLPAAGSGWTPLLSRPGGVNLDYIRANLFDPAAMRLLPPDVSGPDNDLADLLDHYVQRATGDPGVTAYVFGQRFGPEPTIPDKVFGFLPGNGVHDVHMNRETAHSSPAMTGSGRTAACCCIWLPSRGGSRSFWRSRARPGTPTTPPVTPLMAPSPVRALPVPSPLG